MGILKKRLVLVLSAALAACLVAGGACMLPARSAAAEAAGTCVRVTDEGLLSDGYLSAYRYGVVDDGGVCISAYSANGGNYGGVNGNTADKAFDGSFSTFWETNSPNTANFTNHFTVTFSAAAQIDRIIYATRQDGYGGRGYPSVLTVYISSAENGEDFEKVCAISSSNGGNKVLFDLGGIVECRRMRLEFTQIGSDLKYASASELIFLQPEEEAARAVRAAFADYTRHTFTEEFAAHAEAFIAAAKETAAYAYGEEVKFLADRAESVLNGEVSFDPAFELSTADGAANPILRAGDTAGYARNTLKMVWMGTNRQVTGIGAAAGATLNVFVDCDDGDPLPTIMCSQFIGSWNRWQGKKVALSKGLNVIEADDLYLSEWTNTVPGGPVYIINPYTKEQQSGNVKVYIEGGYSFPVYRAGGDVETYLGALESYLGEVGQSPDRLPDMTELASDNVILTVTATQARRQYVDGGFSPARALENWREYLHSLYAFCGIYDAAHYDSRSQYLNVNIRVMQSLSGAAAYAIGEHIGIYPNGDWEVTCLQAENFGWGVTHELGHMMEISEREWGEYTNNMWSQYNKCALSGEDARGNFAAFLEAAVKDGVPYEERDAYTNHTDAAISWWLIESRYPGFWGRFENNYRFANRANLSDRAELHVYFASLAAGVDLSYYFERIGFKWNGANSFCGYDAASEDFRAAMSAARAAELIEDAPLKLWYQDAKAYNYTARYGAELAIYTGAEQVNFMQQTTDAGTVLLMDAVSDFRHLGYEILRGNETDGFRVIGFTYGRLFADASGEAGAQYRVRAYDRALGCTALSAAAGEAEMAARTNGQDYATLAEAIGAASAGGTVYVLSDAFAAGIAVEKDVTLTPYDADVTVYLSAASAMFTVAGGAAFTIEGGGHVLTLDGVSMSKNEALVVSNGTLTLRGGVVLQNSLNGSGNGGALRVAAGTLNLSGGVVLQNNAAAGGGAVAAQQAGAKINVEGAIFQNNTASGNGGALYARCTMDISGAVFERNAAAYGGAILVNNGGVLMLSGCTFRENTASSQGGALHLNGKTAFGGETTVFTGNSANAGGAVYVASDRDARRVVFSAASFTRNTAAAGGAVYLAGYAALGAAGTMLEIDGAGGGAGAALFAGAGANVAEIAGALRLFGGVVLYAPLSFGAAFSAEESEIRAVFTLSGAEKEVIARFAAAAEAMGLRAFADAGNGVYAAALEGDADGWALRVSGTRAYAVTVADGDNADTAYYVGGETFVLPQAAPPQGYLFRGWLYGGRLYAVGETVAVSADMTFTAVYEAIGDAPDDGAEPGGGDGGADNGADGGSGGATDGADGGDGFSQTWMYVIVGIAAGLIVIGGVAMAIFLLRRKN